MLAIARRAGASKETLYSWFGSREGRFAALIEENAAQSTQRVEAALADDVEPRTALVGFATGLLRLLTSERAVVLNRAAMGSPELARVLLASGRHTLGPLVERYLTRLAERGTLRLDDAADAFRLLYGLVIEDAQIRVLLGEDPPPPAEIEARAARAVDRFFALLSG
jgi:AcrR family transcriptional regulator